MLTDEQLDIISEALVPLFQYLEKEVIADVASRIKATMTYSRTAEIQAIAMRKLGYSPARIRKEAMKLLSADADYRKTVAKNTLEYKRKVRKLLNQIEKEAALAGKDIMAEAGNMSWTNDLSIWKDAGKKLTDDSFLPQLVEAFQKQTAGELRNLTRTSGYKTMSGYEALESAYRRELDKAMIKLCTGTWSREKILQDTIHSLAQSGLRSIDFSGGYSMQLDTAVRVSIRTACHQIAAKMTDRNIKETGENLVYVSKHWGARNTGTGHANHEEWQGKVYYIRGGTDYGMEAYRIGQERITSLWYATGYSADGEQANDPLGLHGYNCRHNHYPWFEGSSELPKENPEPQAVEINGKTYDYYAVTQKMRSMERAVRALKREKEALKALNMDTVEINARIVHKRAEYSDFCKKAGIKEKSERLRYECGTSDLKKTKTWKEYESAKKDVAVSSENDTIGSAKEKNVKPVTEITHLGKIDTSVLEPAFGKILTDDVIVTSERIEHIKAHHPQDYELFEMYGKECISNPDVIVQDIDKTGTIFMVKNLSNTNLNVIIRLVLEHEDSKLKNSVMTFWRIRDRNLKKMIEKNSLLYKRE